MERTAIVFGGSSGIGAAAVNRLRADGLVVVVADIDEGADIRVDVRSFDAVAAAADSLGAVDVLVNSAGIVGVSRPFWEISSREFDDVLDVNLGGTFNTCKAFAPAMVQNGWGRIVNIASMFGKDGNANMAAYSASKAAVIGFTKSIAKDLAKSGVLANSIAPAVVATPMNADTDRTTLDRLIGLIPLGRLGRPEEVAELIAWLSSDRCSFSTGAVYDISGGRATY